MITTKTPSNDCTFGILEYPSLFTPNEYEPTFFMLLKSCSLVYKFVIYGKYPATLLKWVYRSFKHFLGVAGNIGINDTWLRGRNWAGKDANEITVSGLYLNMNTMTHVPSEYGTIISVVHQESHCVQVYCTASSPSRLYYRSKSSGAWTSWQQISFT